MTCGFFLCSVQGVFAQVTTVVVVDDSPTADLLLQRAVVQAVENPEEAARLCAEIIDDYGTRLVPDSVDPDLYLMARSKAEELLLLMPEVQARFVEVREPLAARLLDEGRADDAMRLAWVTPSGGEAAMRRAQRAMESLHFTHALRELRRLGRHPFLSTRSQAYRLMMLGLVTYMVGDFQMSLQYEEQLESLGGDPDLLEHLRATKKTPLRLKYSVSDVFESESSEVVSGDLHRIWKVEVDETPFGLQSESAKEYPSDRVSLLDSTKSMGNLLLVAPLVTANAVFVDDGTSISRFDRYGAQLDWTYRPSVGRNRIKDVYVELSEMDSDGRNLVALSGLGLGTRRTTPPTVLCLNALDGSLRWSTDIDACDFSKSKDLDGRNINLLTAFPYSGPIIDGDKVIIPVRRIVAATRESVEYLLALDLASGKPAWIRLLGSSGSLQMVRRFSRTILSDGNLITASPLGTISCIDSSSGTPQWVRKFEVDAERSASVIHPWEISQPVVIDGKVFALTPNAREVVSIALATGEILNQWPSGIGTRFGDARYLLSGTSGSGEELLFVVGEDIHCMDVSDEIQLRWRFSDSARDENASREGITDRNGIRGRVHVSSGCLLIPGVSDLFIIDLEDGHVRDIIETGEPSNPVSIGSEIILGESASVSSLMQLKPAKVLLREQIGSNPEAASRVLALAELGIQSGDSELVLEAASIFNDQVGIEVPGEIRQKILDLILSHESSLVVPERSLTNRLLDAAEKASILDHQFAGVIYARGLRDFKESRLDSALDLWGRLLEDESLSSQLVARGNMQVNAGRLVSKMIMSRPELSALWNLRCSEVVERLQVSDAPVDSSTAHALMGSDVSFEILWDIQNDPQNSLSVPARTMILLHMASLRPNPTLLADIVGTLKSIGRSDDAARIELMMSQNGQVVTPVNLRSKSSTRSRVLDSPPSIGTTPGVGLFFEGLPVPGPESSDLCLVISKGMLRSFTAFSSSQGDWAIPFSATSAVEIVKEFDGSFVLVTGSDIDQPAFRLFSKEDGHEIAASDTLGNLMPKSTSDFPSRSLMPNKRLFEPSALLLSDSPSSVVALMRRSGSVVGVSLDDAEPSGFLQSKWRHDQIFSRIYSSASCEDLLVLYGIDEFRNEDGSTNSESKIRILDMASGEIISEFVPRGVLDVTWIEITPVGTILLGSSQGVQCWTSGLKPELLWNQSSERGATLVGVDMFQPVYFGDSVIIPKPGSELVIIDIFTGSTNDRGFQFTDLAQSGGSAFRGISATSDSLIVMTDNQVMQWNVLGEMIGYDSLFNRGNLLFMYRADGVLVVVERVGRSLDEEFNAILYRFHFLDIENGLMALDPPIEFSAPLSPNHDFRSAMLIDDWMILLLRGTRNIAIPLPAQKEESFKPQS